MATNDQTTTAVSLFPSGSNLGAIVARMQERAVAVTSEEDELQRAKKNLEQVRQEYTTILKQRTNVRRLYLQQQVDQNTAELVSIQTEQETEVKKKIVTDLQNESADILAGLGLDKQNWKDIEVEIGQHRRRQMLYLRYLQGLVMAEEASIQQRSDRLVLVKELTENQKVTTQQLREQEEYNRTIELPQVKDRHGAATADADKLAKQVRDAIATRSTLRDTLRERQDYYGKAVEASDALAAEFRSS